MVPLVDAYGSGKRKSSVVNENMSEALRTPIGTASQVVGLSFNAYFPTLTKTLGYSTTVTLLLCAPPWAFATIVAFLNAR